MKNNAQKNCLKCVMFSQNGGENKKTVKNKRKLAAKQTKSIIYYNTFIILL